MGLYYTTLCFYISACVFGFIAAIKDDNDNTGAKGWQQEFAKLDSLLLLMTLKERECPGTDWCVIQGNEADSPWPACCNQCSCNDTCLHVLNCCPDFILSKVLNGLVFNNVTDLRRYIEQNTAIQGVGNFTHTENLDKETMCIRSQLLEISPHRAPGSEYKMIAKCTGDAFTLTQREACEGLYNFEGTFLSDHIPVQALATGHVYKNKHCFSCSRERNDQFTYWDVYMETDDIPNRLLSKANVSLNDIYVEHIKKAKLRFYSSNLYFEPSANLIKRHPPIACVKADVETCHNSTLNTTEDGRAYTEACEHYVSPVLAINYDEHPARYKTYKNVACLSCNTVTGESCSGFSVREDFGIHFRGKINQNLQSEDSVANRRLRHSMSGARCETGYIFDEEKNLCRLLLCPCWMVVVDGVCTAVFDEINKGPYEVFLLVRTKQTPFLSRVAQQIQNYIEKVFGTSAYFALDAYGVWNSSVEEVFVAVKFTGQSSATYTDALRLVQGNFRGEKHIQEGNFNAVIEMSLTDHVTVGKIARHSITGKTLKVINSMGIDKFSLNAIMITPCHMCYRLEVLKGEVISQKRVQMVKATGEITFDRSIMYGNLSRLVLCAQLLVKVQGNDSPFVQPNIVLVDPYSQKATDLSIYVVDDIVIAMSVFFAFTLLSCLLNFSRKIRQKALTPRSQHSTTFAAISNDVEGVVDVNELNTVNN